MEYDNDTDLRLEFCGNNNEAVWRAGSILDACRGMPIQTTKTLFVEGVPPDVNTRITWFSYLCYDFRRVQVLNLLWSRCGIASPDTLVAYLLTGMNAANGCNPENLIMPALRKLHIRGIPLRVSVRNPKSYYRRLGRALMRRREIGVGIEGFVYSAS